MESSHLMCKSQLLEKVDDKVYLKEHCVKKLICIRKSLSNNCRHFHFNNCFITSYTY